MAEPPGGVLSALTRCSFNISDCAVYAGNAMGGWGGGGGRKVLRIDIIQNHDVQGSMDLAHRCERGGEFSTPGAVLIGEIDWMTLRIERAASGSLASP
ncbi:hypothetical protein AAFF_G00015450 [Aldrovandia affinis]|uniref:Uncharacterized protein n=1 Tax=Aldrovandia affinis TaxID=143900 RepID=A0AAD7S635_9TELE|nr:hypothetical protein AAFF_G00015450 [Aldrovandia affinis]